MQDKLLYFKIARQFLRMVRLEEVFFVKALIRFFLQCTHIFLSVH